MLRMRILSIVLVLSLAAGSVLRADLVWTAERGWTFEGGLLAEVFGDSPEAPRHGVELMEQARQSQERGRNWQALRQYRQVIREYPTSILAPEAHYQRGRIFTSRNQFERAFKEYEEIIRRYPDFDKFNLVIVRMYDIAESIQDGARPYYWGIIPGFRDRQTGIDIFEGVVRAAPFSDYAPLALMNIAHLANKDNKPEEAIDALDRLINTYPDTLVTADAYLSLADTYASLVQGPHWDQGATRSAISFYQDYLILFPDTDGAFDAEAGLYYLRETYAESKFEMGQFYYRYRNNPRAAAIFYNEAITADPESSVAVRARQMLEKIDQGIKAPRTPVDFVFGRYRPPSGREYVETSEIEAREYDIFRETTPFLGSPMMRDADGRIIPVMPMEGFEELLER